MAYFKLEFGFGRSKSEGKISDTANLVDEQVALEIPGWDFVTHISERNSPYGRGTIHGVLMDTLDCLKHLILDGKSVRFSDLGLFSIGMTSRGEVSKEKVTAASVLGVHLIVRNTKTWSNAELKKLTKIVAYYDYTSGAVDGGGTENTPGGGDTSQGAGGDTSQGTGGDTNKDNGGTSQGGGGTDGGGVNVSL